MPVVLTTHRKCLSVPDAYKSCVKSKVARQDGGKELETALNYFTEKIKEVERKVVDSTNIVDFLLTTNDENQQDNYYDAGTKTSKIRTAVVQCNFTDSETLMRSVEDKCKDHKVERVIVSSHATSVQGVLEEAREKNCNHHTIIIIEQLESMDVDVFNRLISLLSYEVNKPERKEDKETPLKNVSLLICICTSRSAFISHCVMDNELLLYPKFFPLASPLDQFDEVAAVLTRNTDKKAPKLYLSGELLLLLKNRFLGDFSLAELKKIVRLSIADNFLKYDEYMAKDDDDFVERLDIYWEWFDAMYLLIADAVKEIYGENAACSSQIDVHTAVQQDADSFWKKSKEIQSLKNWMCMKNREQLCETIEIIATVIKHVSPEEAKKLSDRAASLRTAAAAAPSTPSQAPSTPAGGAKMKMSELLAANRAKQAAAAGSVNQLREAVGEVLAMMREQLFDWRKDGEDYLLLVPEGIEIPDLSKSLMTRTDRSLSHAFTALAGIDQFKAVPMAQWGEVVKERMGNGEFYDCVAQLERMGMVKDVSKQGRKAVMLQHRPMMNFN